jgi:hypothetical protein
MDGGDDGAAGFHCTAAVYRSSFIWGRATNAKCFSLVTIITANILLTRIPVWVEGVQGSALD